MTSTAPTYAEVAQEFTRLLRLEAAYIASSAVAAAISAALHSCIEAPPAGRRSKLTRSAQRARRAKNKAQRAARKITRHKP